jgi:hypothetical protein
VILAASTICLELTTVLETSTAHVQLLELGRHGRLALEPTALDLFMAKMAPPGGAGGMGTFLRWGGYPRQERIYGGVNQAKKNDDLDFVQPLGIGSAKRND